jgi:hypothetical protein
MKTKLKYFIRAGYRSFGLVCAVAVILQLGVLAGSAQTGQYLFTGSETNITLNPGTYDITVYGARGGNSYYYDVAGGPGAEMEGQFYFAGVETLTILVGGAGGGGGPTDSAYINSGGGGGGGGSFVVNGTTPLVIAGGGGGGGQEFGGSSGLTATNGGSGGGFYGYTGGSGGSGGSASIAGGGGGFNSSGGTDTTYENGADSGYGGNSFFDGGEGGGSGSFGGGGSGGYGGGGGGGYLCGGGGGGYSGGGGAAFYGGGGGGGSFIDSSAITNLTEVSGIYSPDGQGNGEIIITAVTMPMIICPEPLTLECINGAAVGTVQVGVVDSNGLPVEVVWTVDNVPYQTNYIPAGGAITSSSLTLTATFGSGEHVVLVSASNGQTVPATCSATVTVQDTIPPQILRIVADPNKLWPPNHRLIPVNVIVESVDNCDPSPVSKIIKVSSNESENRFRPDWEITGPLSVNLRAENFGFERERIYKIEIQCEDASGNVSYGSVEVPVRNDNERFLTPLKLK